MASNDLMMRIQLLVDSGRASNELRRLQAEINALARSIKSLDAARIAPLTQEIDALKRAASGLRSVNLSNFTGELDALKTAFAGLRLPTTILDDLRSKYAALNREIGAGTLRTLQGDLARVKTELIQTRGNLVPLQNEIRKIRSEKAFDKLSTDRLNSSLKVSRADLALLRNELQEAVKTPGGLSSRGRTTAVIASEIDTLNKSILNSAKQIALAEQAQFNRAEPILRIKQRELANQQNLLNLKQQEIREITNKVVQQKALEQGLQREIQQLTRLATAQANARKTLLQSDLASARGTRAGLQSRLREIQDEAKAEIQRIRAVDEGTRALGRQRQELTTLGRLFRGGSGAAREFGAALRFAFGPQMVGFAAAGGILQLFGGFFAANKELENLNRGLNALTGGSAALYFDKLVKSANSTGQSLHVVTDSFLQLVAASKGTRLEGAATREIFQSVSQALVITGADAVRSRRAFLALAQMMSKGQVFAEELRQQLSEALPGAVQIFARALDITPQKMFDLMRQGEVSSESLLLFARQLQQEMPAISEDLFTFTQKSALLQNSMRLLFKEIGDTGIWDAFGDGLLRARDLIERFRGGIGGTADAIKREFRFNAELLEISGIGSVLGGALEGFVGLASGIVQRAVSVLEELPVIAAQVAVSTRNAIEQVAAAAGGENLVGNAIDLFNALSDKSSEFSSDFSKRFALAFQLGTSEISQGFSAFLEGGINNRIRDAEQNLSRLLSVTRLTKEEFESLPKDTRVSGTGDSAFSDAQRKNIESFGEYNALYGEALAKAKEELRLAKERLSVFESQNKAIEERNRVLDQSQVDREFIDLFDPKTREIIQGVNQEMIDLQRGAENVLRVSKENERTLVNRIQQTKAVWGIERDIESTLRRAKEVEAERIGDRNKDAMDSLRLELDRAKVIEQSEKNAKDLGFGYDPERSKQEFRAYQLRQQAQKEIKAAASATNAEEKKGALERAKLLTEETNQLNLQAGRTYALKQGYEDIKKIQSQLTAEGERRRKQEESSAEYAVIKRQAEEAYAKATDKTTQLTGAQRDEFAKIADELLKLRAQKALDLGFGEEAARVEKLRLEINQLTQATKSQLQDKIDVEIAKLNQKDLNEFKETVQSFTELRKTLLEQRQALLERIQGGGGQQVKDALGTLDGQINRLDSALGTLKTRFETARLAGELPAELADVVFPATLDEIKAEEIKRVKAEAERVANQQPIVLPTTVSSPEAVAPTLPIKPDLQPPTQEEARGFWKPIKDFFDNLFSDSPFQQNAPEIDNEAASAYFENWKSINRELVVASTNVDALRQAQFLAGQSAEQTQVKFEGFALPLQNANQNALAFRQTLQALQAPKLIGLENIYQDAERVKQLLQEINALQAQQPQVSFQPIVDSAELQAKRKQLERELAKPVKVPVGVEITQGTLESAKQAVQAIPDANIRVSTVLVEDSVAGVKREVQRLTAQATPLPLEPDLRTELLDREFRKIDGQLEKWNRTAGSGITQGFRTAAEQARDFNTLVDQTNQKMRAIQENAKKSDAELAAAFAQQREAEIQVKVDRGKADAEFKKFNEETKRLLEDPDPIRLLVDNRNAVEAQRLIGEIQADLKKLKDAGATNIEVRFDEKTGKLTVTADTSQADASVEETIAKINASTAVLNVRVRYNDPGFTPRNTSVNVTARRWGGPIPGYGGGDRVRALLEPGEFVLRKEAVRSIGLDKLFEMNRQKRLPRAPRVRDSVSVPRMASGGPVMGSPITINVPGRQPIRVSGSRDQAEALANLLTSVGRAL